MKNFAKNVALRALAIAMAGFAAAPAQAWRGGGFGGFHDGGGFVAHGPNGGWAAGGFHDGGVGGWGGTWHGDGYHPGAWGGYGYHGPVTVNSYYGGGCWGCGAAAGAAVGAAAAVAGAVAARNYAIGATLATLPGGCIARIVGGASYYVCDGSWLQPIYGNNGIYYTVVNPM